MDAVPLRATERSTVSEADDIAERLRAEFHRALQEGQLIRYFQPEVELPTGQLVAAELLARWEDPELGTLPPSSFLSVAEELRLEPPGRLRFVHGGRIRT